MKRALIVGIDNYSFGPLKGCVADAKNMYEVLSFNGDTDFPSPNFHCNLLISDSTEITRKKLTRAIREILDDSTGTVDSAVFYFAGHGYENELGGYLVTQDAELYSEGVAMSNILKWCNDSSINEITIILDCCHAGHLGNAEASDSSRTLLPRGVSIITSSDARQKSKEAKGEGLFTSIIYEALSGGAADILGNITVPSLYHYADRMLGPMDQRPVYKTYVPELTPIRKVKPRITRSQLYQLTQLFQDPKDKFPLCKSHEPTEKLGNKENEKVFTLLQKMTAAGLVQPIGEEHMYWAAVREKSCGLTPQGQFYWQITKKGRF